MLPSGFLAVSKWTTGHPLSKAGYPVPDKGLLDLTGQAEKSHAITSSDA